MSKNDVTGDDLRSKTGDQDAFASGWDLIWGKEKKTGTTEGMKPVKLSDKQKRLDKEE